MCDDNNKDPDKNSGEIRVVEEIAEGYLICPNCGAKSGESMQKCGSCGLSRTDDIKPQLQEAAANIVNPAEGVVEQQISAQPPKPLSKALKIGCGITAILLLVFVFLATITKEGQIQIVATSWERTIELVEYQTVEETGWRGEMPTAARELSSKSKIRSYEDVPDGFEEVDEIYTEQIRVGEKMVEDGRIDLGDGKFKINYSIEPIYEEKTSSRRVTRQKFRKEPVYDEKVRYQLDKWVEIEPARSSGTTDEPKWPASPVKGNASAPVIGDVAERKRHENYLVKAKILGTDKEIEINSIDGVPLSYQHFMKLRQGTKWKAVFSGLGILQQIQFIDP